MTRLPPRRQPWLTWEKKTLNLAEPDNLVFVYCTGGGQLLGFAEAIEVGAVAGHIKANGCHHRAVGVDDLQQGGWAAPGDQQEGGRHSEELANANTKFFA